MNAGHSGLQILSGAHLITARATERSGLRGFAFQRFNSVFEIALLSPQIYQVIVQNINLLVQLADDGLDLCHIGLHPFPYWARIVQALLNEPPQILLPSLQILDIYLQILLPSLQIFLSSLYIPYVRCNLMDKRNKRV